MIYRVKLFENSVWKQSKTVKLKEVTFKTRKIFTKTYEELK